MASAACVCGEINTRHCPVHGQGETAAWPRLREISQRGYPLHRRLWNRLRWSLVGRRLRGI